MVSSLEPTLVLKKCCLAFFSLRDCLHYNLLQHVLDVTHVSHVSIKSFQRSVHLFNFVFWRAAK